MNKIIVGLIVAVVAVLVVVYVLSFENEVSAPVTAQSYSHTEPGFEPEPEYDTLSNITIGAPAKYTIAELQNWERRDGPLTVGIQVGHWQNATMPEELENLERNTGATWGGMTESEVVLVISELLQDQLQEAGIEAKLLPAAVPPGYEADVFLSIHADGNPNSDVNGFKLAAPRRDYAGTSQQLVDIMYQTYAAATGLRIDPSITRRMTAYYAFNWPRYEYAIHPFTPAVIVETGFLTSPTDRAVILDQPELAAKGIADAVIEFLNTDDVAQTPVPIPFTDTPKLPLSGEVTCAPLRAERLDNADRYDCLPSITNTDGNTFILASYTSSTVPLGSEFTATGDYMPVHNLGTYFWFPYEVNGFIIDPTRPMPESRFFR